jgi:hypothetical protein
MNALPWGIGVASVNFEHTAHWHGSWSAFFLSFDPAILVGVLPPSMSSTDLYGNWAYGLDDSHEDLILAMQSARTSFRAGRPAGSAFRESIARAVVPQFFMRCQELSALPDAANSSLHKRDLDRVIEYIKSNLTRRLTVAEIAGYFE